MVDATDLKSVEGNLVRVRVPPSAPAGDAQAATTWNIATPPGVLLLVAVSPRPGKRPHKYNRSGGIHGSTSPLAFHYVRRSIRIDRHRRVRASARAGTCAGGTRRRHPRRHRCRSSAPRSRSPRPSRPRRLRSRKPRRTTGSSRSSIFDMTGQLVYFEKADGTQYGSIQVAQDKGRSAALYRRPTTAFASGVNGGNPALMTLGRHERGRGRASDPVRRQADRLDRRVGRDVGAGRRCRARRRSRDQLTLTYLDQ